ncbi:hypothetical protein [Flexivirga meconopsidis]|uniref:hypothetical protein n=1 Tax=Flexivirga meconopsidis TaxID=2977121 RepID=UPI002240A0E9|nr:hypothetical protein [Flexivirga meconopsidis]
MTGQPIKPAGGRAAQAVQIAWGLTILLIVLVLIAVFTSMPWWPVIVVAVASGLWWGFGRRMMAGEAAGPRQRNRNRNR